MIGLRRMIRAGALHASALGPRLPVGGPVGLALGLAMGLGGEPHPGHATLSEADLREHLAALAGPSTEGRDSPSRGLEAAAAYVARRFAEAGLACAPDSVAAFAAGAGDAALGHGPHAAGEQASCTYLRPFLRPGHAPVPDECRLELLPATSVNGGAEPRAFEYGKDFVPVAGFDGAASGELVFAGFAIDSSHEKYNDFAGLAVQGRIALVLQGEPDHPRRFDGHAISSEGSLWTKLERLAEAGAKGVLVVRRGHPDDAELAYRHTWAQFNEGGHRPEPQVRLPLLELSPACATALLGRDVRELFQRIDKRVRPERVDLGGREVSFAARSVARDLRIDNVVGWIEGADPALRDEVVVVGAHYDHLGVDSRGRIGFGADDNASGTAALIELAEALAASAPRRSVAVCAFAAEEDGLLGSRAFCANPPVPVGALAAMLNMDMIGRGDRREVAIIGVGQNPDFERVLKRAQDASATGVRKLVLRQGEELFQRSDHFPFHERGVPVLFFFEGLPITRNKDYHTWNDTIDQLDFDKIHNTARLVFNTAWILANDDQRLPAPRD